MKRDMDLIRDILLQIEGGREHFETVSAEAAAIIKADTEEGLSREEADKREHHLELLQDAGYARFTRSGEGWLAEGLTWKGHDFLDSVRDDEVWRRTKEGARKAGGFTVGLLADVGKAIIKAQIEKAVGLSLD